MAKKTKTAISIQDSLFKEAEGLARELRISRSQLFAMAVERYVASYRNRKLLEQIDRSYSEAPDPAEERARAHRKRTHRRLVEGEW